MDEQRHQPEELTAFVGLCAGCRHARAVPAARATYWLCERSKTDPRFPRYPRLPVIECAGHEPGSPSPITSTA